MMDREAYSIDKGRPRPQYKPKDIHCKSCGAGLTVKDEHAELVVCEYCGTHLKVTAVQQKVLSKGPSRKTRFPLKLGDSFRYQSHRYEVIARMAFIEDGLISEMTRQYLLFNPRVGTCWLDEYGHRYSISQVSHVMPEADPFARKRGDLLGAHDSRKWVCEEVGEYELHYVDGALPWIAKVGDRVAYADFVEESGSGNQYQVERTKNEIEYSVGRALDIEVVRRATGKPKLGGSRATLKVPDAAVMRRFYRKTIAAAALAAVINLALMLFLLAQGSNAFSQRFTAEELNGEVLSEPFRIDSSVVKVITQASPRLYNEWMALDVAFVSDQDAVLHVYDQDISYYAGYEGGESWTEGRQSESTYVRVPQPGTYRLLVRAVSGLGNANQATSTSHGAYVRVKDGARMPHFFIGTTALSAVMLVLLTYFYFKWQAGDEWGEDEDD